MSRELGEDRKDLLQIAGGRTFREEGYSQIVLPKVGISYDSDFYFQLSVVISIWMSQQQLKPNVFKISVLLQTSSSSSISVSATIFIS